MDIVSKTLELPLKFLHLRTQLPEFAPPLILVFQHLLLKLACLPRSFGRALLKFTAFGCKFTRKLTGLLDLGRSRRSHRADFVLEILEVV